MSEQASAGQNPEAIQVDENALIAERRAKLARLREKGIAFPSDFRRNVVAGELHAEYGEKDKEWFEENTVRAKVAGRVMAKRIMGKASFAHILDAKGHVQLYLRREHLGEDVDPRVRKLAGDGGERGRG